MSNRAAEIYNNGKEYNKMVRIARTIARQHPAPTGVSSIH